MKDDDIIFKPTRTPLVQPSTKSMINETIDEPVPNTVPTDRGAAAGGPGEFANATGERIPPATVPGDNAERVTYIVRSH